MRIVNGSLAILGLAALTANIASPVQAAGGGGGGSDFVCGANIQVTGTVSGEYDPFNPTGITASATINVDRSNETGGNKTQNFAFFLVPTPPPTVPAGTEIQVGSINILGPVGGPLPAMVINNLPQGNVQGFAGSPNGWVEVGFGGESQPDLRTAVVNFVFGPGWDLTTDSTIFFDMYYVCKGTGGTDSVDVPTSAPTGVMFDVTIRSGLQASFAGTLDFGEIGDVATVDAPSYSVGGFFNVLSSGPYEVELESDKDFLMSHLAVPGAPGMDTVAYELSFLGESLTTGDTFGTHICPPAGITTPDNIPITATLTEGGVGKTPSPSYSDMLTVTITPLAAATGTVGTCP